VKDETPKPHLQENPKHKNLIHIQSNSNNIINFTREQKCENPMHIESNSKNIINPTRD
jgi:hypothetical protein